MGPFLEKTDNSGELRSEVSGGVRMGLNYNLAASQVEGHGP
jgi:hypothetical protein